jgi:hypothetical protein
MSVRYLVSLKKFPNIEDLTPEGVRDKLSQETDNLVQKIKTNFPKVKILFTRWRTISVVIKIPDEKTAEEMRKVCDCIVQKMKKKK